MMSEVKRLELRHDQDLDAKLFKLKLGSKLRLTVSAGIYAEDVRVFTSYPADGYPHDRKHLRELQWTYSTPQCNWDIDRYIDVTLTRSGPYRLVWTLGEDLSGVLSGHCYFIVEPDLGYSPNSISCQTHITKLLGPLSQWKQRLMVAWKSGYNMIHFTPPHQLGSSRSAYSISNQLKMDSAYLPSGYSHVTTPISCTDACGNELSLEVDGSFVELKQLIDDLRTNHGVLSIVDVVWNHTSFDTPWLIQHPEAGYNLFNSPHLRPAYKLDSVIYQFSCEIANGQWISHGIHPHISSEHDIRLICDRLLDTVLPQAKLWEYYSVDVEAIVKEFRSSVYRLNGGEHPCPEGKHLTICQDSQYRRLGSTVNKTLTIELFNVIKSGAVCFEERMEQCCNDLRNVLRNLNTEIEDKTRHSLYEAVNNIAATMRYQFLEGHGPKRYHITVDKPFVDRYFVKVGGGAELNDEEIEGGKGLNVLAHNGWVMNADPLVNFAEEGSNVYFKRELIVWGDSVKLRYGSGPSDSQWLWDHMTLYTRIMAWVFDGFRLDNCHNTPIHVAEGLLDSARDVNHNLYLVAELFTPSEERDNYFVNRLGINSLIREAMFAHNPRELGRLVYKYGGLPVASFFNASSLQPSTPHAMFLDATHDNEPGHILSRSVQDALPNTALMAIASCASGSCRGYDELVPHKIEVVSEKRLYPGWSDSTSPSPHPWSTIDHTHGLIEAKRLLNQLHQQLAEEGYHEIFVDQVTEEIIAVTRHCSTNHKSFILMAHCAFHTPPDWATPTFNNPQTHFNSVPSLTVQGSIKGIHMEAKLIRDDKRQTLDHTPSPHYVNGLDQYRLDISHLIPLDQSSMCRLIDNNSPIQEVIFTDFSPGSIIIFEVELLPEAADSVKFIRSFLGCEKTNPDGCGLASRLSSELSSLSFADLNYVLYRCDNEEKADSKGGGAYIVPNIGPMTYCGLQGIMNMIKPIRETNDLGHPLCDNLRSGHWLLGYTSNRLNLRPSIKRLHEIISNIFHHLTLLPHYLIPSYFDAVISQIFRLMIDTCYSKMNRFVADGSSFVKLLALGSVQLYGDVPSATLPPYLKGMDTIGSLAAGLPHFSVGFMRCWGRDTFIALRGLLMVTGRFDEARDTILSFGSCLRHGLIPNLLSGGRAPRYNCRDAVWWWFQSIQDYVGMSPEGTSFLQSNLRRLFPSDDSEPELDSDVSVTLAEVMQEALQCHASGISFTERGAGPGLDRDMTPPGFIVTASVDWDETGFVRGGNQFNCGTWMDKVGESSWAGNKGVPATPRDGSAVELVGLSFSAIKWLTDLNEQGLYPFNGVYTTHNRSPNSPFITLKEWSKMIKDNFEKKFWIPMDEEEGLKKEGELAGYIHRRGIYKDSFNSSHKYTDYQLRPNFSIAMAIAPELFTPTNARIALKQVEGMLLGPLGMKTLDPLDWQYNGNYINSVDSNDYKTARGFNYHQGPEWLWVTGYFLRAKLIFASDKKSVTTSICQLLSNHAQALMESSWSGLPELTNENGADCPDSCPVQAWSMATLLDLLHDLSVK